ncbi:unnamed protein product [Phytophthora lilii]|uniref:Unnamed protein product n=1 Tax=Phytophthora lilii TaxID=2077276 RepID=A0A9W6WZ55_9STRA|nr:unnamed protein product [Phytophthora lilii]
MINFYETIDKKRLKKFLKNEHLELPFLMCVPSPSGSGKSNTVLYIIALLSKCFTKIVICTKANETLYDHLKDTIDNVDVIEEGMVSAISEYDSQTSKLIIFNDLFLEPKKTQAQIGQYFIRGRKKDGVWSTLARATSAFQRRFASTVNMSFLGEI